MDFLQIVFAVIIPTTVGTLIALPFWWKKRIILGNILGSIGIAGVTIVLIAQAIGDWISAETGTFRPVDSLFTLLVGYVFIAWVDVFFVLLLSGLAERRVKNRSLNSDWF